MPGPVARPLQVQPLRIRGAPLPRKPQAPIGARSPGSGPAPAVFGAHPIGLPNGALLVNPNLVLARQAQGLDGNLVVIGNQVYLKGSSGAIYAQLQASVGAGVAQGEAQLSRLEQIFANAGASTLNWKQSLLGQVPSVQSMADWIRAKFQLALGDLSGWTFNPNLRTSFTVSGTLTVNGQAQGISIQALLYVRQFDGTPGATLAAGSGDATGSNGGFSFDAKGSYDVTITDYTVELDVLQNGAIVAQELIPISGATLYSQGVSWKFAIGTYFVLQGHVTLDKNDGNGPQPAVGAGILAQITQSDSGGNLLFSIQGGPELTDANGDYSLEVQGVYNASGDAGSSFDYFWTLQWGTGPSGPNVADELHGVINGATLVAGPVTWNDALQVIDGQVSGPGGQGKKGPQHSGKTP